MKKGIITILAVAIIGVLGIYGKSSGKSSASSGSPASSPTPATNTVATSNTLSDNTSNPPASSGAYKDGTYTGKAVDTPYGIVQIQAMISGGQIVDVKFVTMPDDRGHTQEVTNESAPLLKQETLAKQSAHIDFVSGATSTSEGYQQSLQSALDQAA